MKNFTLMFVSLFFVMCASACGSDGKTKGCWKWDDGARMLVNSDLNLQWDLSDFNWFLADTGVMPENMVFCGRCEEGIVASVLEMNDEMEGDVWSESSEFIRGMTDSMSEQMGIFPGFGYDDVSSEKCYFLYKKALKFSMRCLVSDARIDSGEMELIMSGYLFVKDGTGVILMVTMPYEYVTEFGDIVIDGILDSFGYVNISAEMNH